MLKNWVKLFVLLALSTGVLRAETRRALVIGNDSYPGNALENARNDATAINQALQGAGYESTLILDADRATLSNKVDTFVDQLHSGDTALLYYAGHGMQIEGENFLVPVDFHLTSQDSAKEQGYSLSSVLERFTSHGATTQIVVLDACRDNPFLGSRSMKGGWAGLGTSAGAFLAFGTSPGSTASDAPAEGHGLFTKSLLKYLTSSDLDIEEMFRKVREGVIRDSGGKQVPWVSSSLIGSFHVRPELDAKAPVLEAPPSPSASLTASESGRSLKEVRGASLAEDALETQRLRDALSAARALDYDRAIGMLSRVITNDPGSGVALRLLGLILHVTGRDVEATTALNRAIAVSGTDARAASYKCALSGLSDAEAAVKDCAASVDGEPSADGYLAFAGTLLAKGEPDQAYLNATRSISLGGSDLAYALRGMVAKQQGRNGLAQRDFSRAAQLATNGTPR
jgi:uncharacterized caspase-like protein